MGLYEDEEQLIKETFKESFSEKYRDYLISCYNDDIVEILYMAFARGWMEKTNQEDES